MNAKSTEKSVRFGQFICFVDLIRIRRNERHEQRADVLMGLTAKRRRKAVLLIKWIHQCGVFLLVFVACLEPARAAPEFKAYKLIKIYDKIANSDIHHLKSNDSKQWHHKVESLNSD